MMINIKGDESSYSNVPSANQNTILFGQYF